MNIFISILIAIAADLDNLRVDIAYGIQKIREPLFTNVLSKQSVKMQLTLLQYS
ncbi:MAG: hypothetical protein H6Q70_3037 [Firmicutes bacterium]|nr:hypothetical protein [Bacillota bacterium]